MKKIRWIPMLLSALLLLHPVAYADSAKNFGNDFEGYAENEEIASEMAGTRSWTAVADPDHPGNRVGMIKYVGKNTAALNPQTIASKLGAVTDELEIGLKLKFAANCTNNQSIQFRLKAYTGSKGADVVPWRIHIRGLEEAYNQKILPNSAFAADTWYDVRILVHLKTERYEAFRIKMDDLNAEWEQMTPDGGQELRESSKYDYDSRGVENLRFEAAGNKPDNEGSEERYVWCDDFFCGQYNAASAAEKVLPADGTQNVNVDEVKPSLTFADEMRASTLTPENIILRKESGEAVSYTGSYEKGARIFQDGQYSFRSGTYTITPQQALDYETDYVIEVTDGVKSFCGAGMVSAVYRFTTEKPKFKVISSEFQQATDGAVKCICTIDNPTETDEEVLFLLAGYDADGNLTAGVYQKATVAKGTKGGDFEVEMTADAANLQNAVLYLWNNFTDYAPKTAGIWWR